MIFVRRVGLLVFVAIALYLVSRLRTRDYHSTLQGLSQTVGLGELIDDEEEEVTQQGSMIVSLQKGRPAQVVHPQTGSKNASDTISPFLPPTLKPAGQPYTRGIVIGRLRSENTTWLDSYLTTDPELQPYLYIVDDTSAPLHTPMNKGHEAMVYFTYILDHYDTLPDVSIFMHPHRLAWHTPELLNHDAVEVLKRISSERITRDGYMNLRCHWDPGCPEHIRPGRSYRDNGKAEEVAIAYAWAEMFPGDPIPDVLGAPCCGQFAVAKHRIQSISKAKFERYRNWLIHTQESDWVSGRVLEYLWQKVFADQAVLCPDARACYCDGYGICFTTSEFFEKWFDTHHYWRKATKELEEWEAKAVVIDGIRNWDDVEKMVLDIPMAGRNWELKEEIDMRHKVLVDMRTEALRQGTRPEVRAAVAGRPWREGDGY